MTKQRRNNVIIGGKIYPVKDKSFLNGKLASYSNELGLEHVHTVKFKDGSVYYIYDSGFGNIESNYACAVLVSKE